jgi:hypothetical protein
MTSPERELRELIVQSEREAKSAIDSFGAFSTSAQFKTGRWKGLQEAEKLLAAAPAPAATQDSLLTGKRILFSESDGKVEIPASAKGLAVTTAPAPTPAPPRSQCQPFGAPEPKTWTDYRECCLATYGGGYHDEPAMSAFRHGMETIFNMLEHENFVCQRTPAEPAVPEREPHCCWSNDICVDCGWKRHAHPNIACAKAIDEVVAAAPRAAEGQRERIIAILLEHETRYWQTEKWNWECKCGERAQLITWDECHKKTREHWADKILAAAEPQVEVGGKM